MANRGVYFTAHDKLMRCPQCHSAHLMELVRTKLIRCRDCGHGCTREEAARAAERMNRRVSAGAGSGIIAPKTYRQQLLREYYGE